MESATVSVNCPYLCPSSVDRLCGSAVLLTEFRHSFVCEGATGRNIGLCLLPLSHRACFLWNCAVTQFCVYKPVYYLLCCFVWNWKNPNWNPSHSIARSWQIHKFELSMLESNQLWLDYLRVTSDPSKEIFLEFFELFWIFEHFWLLKNVDFLK